MTPLLIELVLDETKPGVTMGFVRATPPYLSGQALGHVVCRLQVHNKGWRALEAHLYQCMSLHMLKRHAGHAGVVGHALSEGDLLIQWVNSKLQHATFPERGRRVARYLPKPMVRYRGLPTGAMSTVGRGVDDVSVFLAHWLEQHGMITLPRHIRPANPQVVQLTAWEHT